MSQKFWAHAGIAVLVLVLACGPKLTMPPQIDLTKYQGVGVIGFGCNAEGKMEEYATRRFIITIKAYQKEIRLIDLGTKEEVLESVQKEQLNPEAIRAIGNKYNVDVVFTGELEIKEIQPLVPVNIYSRTRPTRGKTQIKGQRAKAAVKAWLSTRLWETEAGGTIWRSSAQGEEVVKQVRFISETKAIFDATDQQGAFFDLINPMVKQITTDFKREHRRSRRSKNNCFLHALLLRSREFNLQLSIGFLFRYQVKVSFKRINQQRTGTFGC